MEIKVLYKKNYGAELYYPECPASEAIAAAFGVKSFTERQLDVLTRGGFIVMKRLPIMDFTYRHLPSN